MILNKKNHLERIAQNQTDSDDLNKKIALTIAERLDKQQLDEALELLIDFPLEELSSPIRRLIISLWRRLINEAAIDGVMELSILDKLGELDQVFSEKQIDNILSLAQKTTPQDIVTPLTCCLMFKHREELNVGQLWALINIARASGHGEILFNYWQQLIQKSSDHIIDYWEIRQLVLVSNDAPEAVFLNIRSVLTDANLTEQLPLLDIYRQYFFDQQLEKFVKAGASLKHDNLKENILLFLLGMGLSDKQTDSIYPDFKKLIQSVELPEKQSKQFSDFMSAKFYASKENWQKVYAFTESPPENHLNIDSRFFRAMALLKLQRFSEAQRVIKQVLTSPQCQYFHRHSAAQISAQIQCLQQGKEFQTELIPPQPALQTRPLVQGLWVGPKLRWVEQLSISSFLKQGWRYQLYVYNIPEGVPDGVELMDATTILPREMVFKEKALSAAHQGSLGAFSDLFRYKLLLNKGGLWADTDILNLKLFEPEEMRFISTEVVTCGIEGLNGAMLSAPINDPFIKLAYSQALDLINKKQVYFTRIGPQLLAELVSEYGKMNYSLANKNFLNPIGWMEIGILADDFASVAKRLEKQKPHNVHLYTESWRISGLSLEAKPDRNSFIGAFYAAYLENDKSCITKINKFIGSL